MSSLDTTRREIGELNAWFVNAEYSSTRPSEEDAMIHFNMSKALCKLSLDALTVMEGRALYIMDENQQILNTCVSQHIGAFNQWTSTCIGPCLILPRDAYVSSPKAINIVHTLRQISSNLQQHTNTPDEEATYIMKAAILVQSLIYNKLIPLLSTRNNNRTENMDKLCVISGFPCAALEILTTNKYIKTASKLSNKLEVVNKSVKDWKECNNEARITFEYAKSVVAGFIREMEYGGGSRLSGGGKNVVKKYNSNCVKLSNMVVPHIHKIINTFFQTRVVDTVSGAARAMAIESLNHTDPFEVLTAENVGVDLALRFLARTAPMRSRDSIHASLKHKWEKYIASITIPT